MSTNGTEHYSHSLPHSLATSPLLLWICPYSLHTTPPQLSHLLGILEVVPSVNVHPFDGGTVGNLQGGQAMGKVRLSRQNSWH